MKKLSIAILLAGNLVPLSADQVIADDLIVQGSICTGFDCVNGENFGADTLMLKENNLRIYFNDTSNSGSFPSNDWRITANDQTNGGANRFSIDDATAGRTIFNIEAGAPTNSLYVDNTGHIGFGTSTPVVDLHTRSGNTPALRLEQDGSSGFASQTWDVAGNEANFFIRDATNGSQLPFQIKPGADTGSLFIAADGDIGIGSTSPDSSLHVRRTDGTAKLHVEETALGTMQLLELTANGYPRTSLVNASTNVNWQTGMNTVNGNTDAYTITLAGTGGSEFAIYRDGTVVMGYGLNNSFILDPSGNLTTTGSINGSSDVNMKENIRPVDSAEILSKIEALPISTWNYIADEDAIRHVGPMAQDFYATFNVGMDDKHIAAMDAAAVAIAGVKALNEQLKEKEHMIAALKTRIADLELIQARLQLLEQTVNQLAFAKNSKETVAWTEKK